LVNKCSFLRLLDLEAEEELQLALSCSSQIPYSRLLQTFNQRVRQANKDNIIHVYLHN
jgi:hypothetical protein